MELGVPRLGGAEAVMKGSRAKVAQRHNCHHCEAQRAWGSMSSKNGDWDGSFVTMCGTLNSEF